MPQNFRFKHIFEEFDDNFAVFKHEQISNLVVDALQGNNCTIFAYGQTGSGKTHTISGGPLKKHGLIQQSFDLMREIIMTDQTHEYEINCQMIQVYKSEVIDLLRDCDQLPRKLTIKQNSRG